MPAPGTTDPGRRERKKFQPILRDRGRVTNRAEGAGRRDWLPVRPQGNNMGSHPTLKARKRRQKLKRRYARLRDDCQLGGVIETTPEGAVRDERVDPARQGCQQLPELVRRALREGWATPDAARMRAVAELLQGCFDRDTAPGERIRLFRTLLLADQTQHERDRAEQSG